MTTSVAPQRVLSNKSTLIGVAVPTPTRKDGTPILLAETPPEGFQKQKAPKTDAPPPGPISVAPPQSQAPRAEAPVLTQQPGDVARAATSAIEPTKADASTRVTRRDLPVQGASRSSRPVAARASNTSSLLLTMSFVIAALVLGGRWYFQREQSNQAAPAPGPAAPTSVEVVPPAAEKPEAPAAAPSVAAPAASAPQASAAPAASTAPPEGTRVVIVTLSPPAARLFRKGKPVGSSPVRIELAPDEKRRSFEVGMPGFVTRRLVVDGSKPEIFVGLKPDGR